MVIRECKLDFGMLKWRIEFIIFNGKLMFFIILRSVIFIKMISFEILELLYCRQIFFVKNWIGRFYLG